MPAILPGYEYDIFISYRQNDNKRDKWVTQFVEALKDELEATLKNPVSIYFDENPHDGLLETDQVGATLQRKLKCLIFIPVISQTYCDKESFAWQHEFLPFTSMIKNDELGPNITLRNGNVVSRVLPVQIHELDVEDQLQVEKVLNGPMRAIPFVFKSKGVNRPLGSNEEHPHDNQDKTYFKDQINKVANALKEIGTTIYRQNENEVVIHEKVQIGDVPKRSVLNFKKMAILLISTILISGLSFIVYQFKAKSIPLVEVQKEKSLVVLPFKDMSPDQDQEWFSDGLAEELLNGLSTVPELKLISRTTAFAFKGKNLTTRQIADSLNVSHVLEGSVRKANDQLRITVQLIKAEDDTHIWSNTYDYGIDSIFSVQEDMSDKITKALDILLNESERDKMMTSGTRNIEAYLEFLKGKAIYDKAHLQSEINSLGEANIYFEKALSMDEKFAKAYYMHHDVFAHNLIGGDSIASITSLSKQEKFELMIHDLDAAIKFTKNMNERLSHQYDRNFLSPSWENLPEITGAIKANRISSGWLAAILNFTDPNYLYEIHFDKLNLDPLNGYELNYTSMALINMNELDSAWNLFDKFKGNGMIATLNRSIILLIKGEYNTAYNYLQGSEFDGSYHLLLAQLLAGKYDEGYEKLENRIDSIGMKVSSYGGSAIQIYNALGEYKKADSVANIIDSKLLGHCSLAVNIAFSGLNFHLSATPNFSARLRELGLDLEAFEKEHYYQYPVVRLE